MALNKKKDFKIAVLHAFVYTIPFILLTQSIGALWVIFVTHALIDGTDIVNRLNQTKNWNFYTEDGYGEDRPDWIRVWLIIFQDNTIHLLINYLAIKYL